MERIPLRRKSPIKRGPGPKRTAMKRKRKKPDPSIFGPQAALCRTLPCLVCGRGPSVPHHDPTEAAGGLDSDTSPLCLECHSEVHTIGRETFAEKHGVDVRAEAARLALQVKGGGE